MGKRLGRKEASARKSRIMNKLRYGEGGKADRLGQKLASVPILGNTAFAPMRGLLSGSVKLFEATHKEDGSRSKLEDFDIGAVKEVVKDTIKGAKSTKK
tara:strand:- start:711 stop:1007 length:297 start_codon:yes stop_codon:yes gene_type:complete